MDVTPDIKPGDEGSELITDAGSQQPSYIFIVGWQINAIRKNMNFLHAARERTEFRLMYSTLVSLNDLISPLANGKEMAELERFETDGDTLDLNRVYILYHQWFRFQLKCLRRTGMLAEETSRGRL